MGDEILTFDLADDSGATLGTFAIEIEYVTQVVEPSLIAPVPLCPPWVEGIMNLQGRIVTVVDPNPILGRPRQVGPVRQVVLINNGQRSFSNLGLKVFRIRQILKKSSVQEAEVAQGPFDRQVFQLDAKLVRVVDVAAFLDGLGQQIGPMISAAPHEGVSV